METNSIKKTIKGIVKPVKKIRRDMPFDTAATDFLLNTLPTTVKESIDTSDGSLLEENVSLKPYIGKYERYYLDDSKNIYREIITIKPDAKVVIRSTKGLLKGKAAYLFNSLLIIRIDELNGEPFFEQLSFYVGRYDYNQLQCLFSLTQTFTANNLPISKQEIIIPMTENGITPDVFINDSMNFYKLDKKYPDLVRYLQSRPMQVPNRVNWI